ncbi:sialidase family protein [Antarcticirhabdus aurantiaca]|uniref:Exo-alpha-sialidase n=1 Tax=Antarcticirhabdus aurantiaca TaxID=2606717 RepID=A0ACD4NR56_9HYPH|nr:exo-alpha-sialidase [Antarcticirhabdus aurantiaca]WAJ29385.1 exo-alpha-sialidase [Jeongeuplla avenae]
MAVEEIANRMTGELAPNGDKRADALLPSPMIQNHAAFLKLMADGTLLCAWFGGSLEGKSDISIHLSCLEPGTDRWSEAVRLSDDPARSEQNPVLFAAPDGRLLLIHTAQVSGNQDECLLRLRELRVSPGGLAAGEPALLDLPLGTFVRAPVTLRDDGAWMLPVFRCIAPPGQRWTGSHDTAGVAVSLDEGATWTLTEVPGSIGCVHMTIVPLDGSRLAAFFRRRQADYVVRSESLDSGRTWSAPEPTDVPNNNSSIGVVRLADGRVAMVCNPTSAATSAARRQSLYDELGESDGRPDATGGCEPVWGVPRAPLTLCLSEDGGRSFPLRHVIEESSGACLSNDSVDGRNQELSYPVLLEAPDGAIHVAFTYKRRAIKHVRLAPGWLVAQAG